MYVLEADCGLASGISTRSGSRTNTTAFDNAPVDSPEANAPHAIRLFCESGSQNNQNGEEVLHLPVIVESAESSPTAAASAANQIKKFLSKEWSTQPHVQYNAIMLIRILCDNPGPTFTRNFDKSFVSTVKDLLRNCKDGSTQQIMRETLDHLENDKQHDEGLQSLFTMWRKEKGQGASLAGNRFSQPLPPSFNRPAGGRNALPSPAELASRVEEAKNTAKILLQLVQSTPADQIVSNELIREFSERCSTAQRSMQRYINADNPAPDHDTMQTLIETNEQLSLALTRYQRAVLAGRRAMGASPSPPQDQQQGTHRTETNGLGAFAASPAHQAQDSGYTPAPTTQSSGFFDQGQTQQSSYGGYQAPLGPPPSQRAAQQQQDNPFADPVPDNLQQPLAPTNYGAFAPPAQQPKQTTLPHSQTFSISSEPDFPPPQRRPTDDLENAYAQDQPQVSPVQTRRPAPGMTASYAGRQDSAANGLTMHGAGTTGTYNSSYDVSPVETRKNW